MEYKNTIVIVDDHPLFLEGIKSFLKKEKELLLIGETNNVDDALKIISEKQPDIALLDIEIKDKSGFDVAEIINKKSLKTKIVFLTMYNDAEILDKALSVGVKGFILKEHTSSELVECIKSVLAGKTYISPLLSESMLRLMKLKQQNDEQEQLLSKLTVSEKRILKLIAQNKTTKEIAVELNISPKTVENHRNNISGKLNLRGTHSLFKFAINKKFQ